MFYTTGFFHYVSTSTGIRCRINLCLSPPFFSQLRRRPWLRLPPVRGRADLLPRLPPLLHLLRGHLGNGLPGGGGKQD